MRDLATRGDGSAGRPGRATGATGVAGVLAVASAEGFSAAFEPEAGARLRCPVCGVASPAEAFQRQWQNRLEGASDPDDMAQVSALVCPACAARGTFVSRYGPGADSEAADVLVSLPRPAGDLPSVGR